MYFSTFAFGPGNLLLEMEGKISPGPCSRLKGNCCSRSVVPGKGTALRIFPGSYLRVGGSGSPIVLGPPSGTLGRVVILSRH